MSAALVALALTGLATLFKYLGPESTMLLAGLLIVLTGVVALSLVASVRCPGCRKSVGVWSMKTQSPLQWLSVLARLDECPYCHHRAASRSA